MADANQAAQQHPQQPHQQHQQHALTVNTPQSGPSGQQEQQPPPYAPVAANANTFPPAQPQSPAGAYAPPAQLQPPGGFAPPVQPQSPGGFAPPGAPGQYPYPQAGYYPGAPQQQPMYPYPQQQPAQWAQQPFYGQLPPQQYSYPPQGWPQPPPSGSMPQQYPPTGPHHPAIPFPGQKEYSSGFRPGDQDMTYDPMADAAVIQKATGAKEVDIKALAQLLPKLTPQKIERLRYILKDPQDLANSMPGLDDGTRRIIHGILLGPKDLDCFILNYALTATSPSRGLMSIARADFGRAWMLSMVLLDRKDGDIEAIAARYWEIYKTPLLTAIKTALAKHSALSNLYLNTLDNIRRPGLSVVPETQKQQVQAEIAADVDKLYAAGVGTFESEMFSLVLTCASTERIKDLMDAFEKKQKQSLLRFLDSKASSTKYAEVREQLAYILQGAMDRDKRDAQLLEDSMKGFGTKDKELSYRLLIIARDKQRLKAVKEAYRKRYPDKSGLVKRISHDTSGTQEKLLTAMAMSDEIV